MAETGRAGKMVAGCSGCLVVVFLAVTVLLTAGSGMVMEMTSGKVSPAELAPAYYISSSCCCLSGVGVIVGIVLLLLGGNKQTEP